MIRIVVTPLALPGYMDLQLILILVQLQITARIWDTQRFSVSCHFNSTPFHPVAPTASILLHESANLSSSVSICLAA